MDKLFLDKGIDKDFKDIKNNKLKLFFRMFINVLKNNKFLSFVGTLVTLTVSIINYNFNHNIKNFQANEGKFHNFSDAILVSFSDLDESFVIENGENVDSLCSGIKEKIKDKVIGFDSRKIDSFVESIKEKLNEKIEEKKTENEKNSVDKITTKNLVFEIAKEKSILNDKEYRDYLDGKNFSEIDKEKSFFMSINYLFNKSYFKNLTFKEFILRFIFIALPLKAFFSIFHLFLNDKFSWKIEKDLRIDLFRHFIDAKYENSSKVSSKIITQFTSSVAEVASQVWIIPNRIMYVLFSFILNLIYDVNRKNNSNLILEIILIFLLSCYFFVLLLRKATSKSKEAKKRYEEENKFIFERLKSIPHIKLVSSEEIEKQKVSNHLNDSFVANRSSLLWSSLIRSLPGYLFVPSIPFILLIIDSSFKNLTIPLLITQFITFTTLSREIEKIANALAKLDELFSDLSLLMESIDILDEGKIEENKKEMKNIMKIDDISFKKTFFHYPSRPEKNVIKNLDFTFKNGKKYGVSGKNGEGKSTITKIILKLFDFSSGDVLISGRSIKSIKTNSIHQKVCRLTNNPFFFNMSIADNVFYPYNNDYDINDEKTLKILERAAEKTRINSFISSLPLGFKTVIKESGMDLSEGQKQQIEAMKIFLRDYDFYILDEILSNVHPQTREVMLKEIFNELKNKTVLAIDHHYDIFKHMDEIYEFSNSKLNKISLDELNNFKESSDSGEKKQ